MCECEKQGYQKALIKDGLNPHVKRSIRLWLWTSLFFFMLLCVCLAASPLLSFRDPDVMLRWLDERAIRCIFGFLVLGFFHAFLEVKCNGNLLGQILQSPMACAIYLSTVFLSTVYLLVSV